MKRIIPLGLLGLATLLTLSTSTASAFGPCCCFCEEGRCQVKVEKEEVETTKFVVECETICIPPLRFPWECGPLKKCGKVRTIKKLGTEKGKKTVCVYDWSALHCCPSCYSKVRGGCGCDSGCDSYSCCAQADVPASNDVRAVALADAAKAAVDFAARFPEVSVAAIGAIQSAKPDSDGWVTLSNHEEVAVASDVELIEVSR
ncbi:hypothetical protein CA13_15760 [Planctomycetes bacterium CA13]|uniref:Uncharacterized protein n=1 Tax=Novipirellula herctigrandis TaxID=2527986 RepID=A0A5C5Z0E2_9BACT|nr:hypothetical protein CA13_15760 [Planctomycetes bacterium CA13]